MDNRMNKGIVRENCERQKERVEDEQCTKEREREGRIMQRRRMVYSRIVGACFVQLDHRNLFQVLIFLCA